MSAERDAIVAAQYVALTTYRRDGTPVTTPVWAAAEGESLYLFSNPHAGKVKRLRNSSRAAIAPCTATGKVTGTELRAEAFIAPVDLMPKVWALLIAKYGLAARLFAAYDWVRTRLRLAPSAGIVVRLSAE